jgi:hypothetical protein
MTGLRNILDETSDTGGSRCNCAATYSTMTGDSGRSAFPIELPRKTGQGQSTSVICATRNDPAEPETYWLRLSPVFGAVHAPRHRPLMLHCEPQASPSPIVDTDDPDMSSGSRKHVADRGHFLSFKFLHARARGLQHDGTLVAKETDLATRMSKALHKSRVSRRRYKAVVWLRWPNRHAIIVSLPCKKILCITIRH